MSTQASLTDSSAGRASLGVKADFPIFARTFDGRPLIYLDSGATSQKPQVVIDALTDFYSWHNANVDGDAAVVAQEIGDVFLRWIYAVPAPGAARPAGNAAHSRIFTGHSTH